MKILIDSTYYRIDKWQDGKIGERIFDIGGDYGRSFDELVEKILTPTQYDKYVCGSHDYVYNISKKREAIMFQEILNYKLKK